MSIVLVTDHCNCDCAEIAARASLCNCAVPVVTGGSTHGREGDAFSYDISATNSPTSYGATGLPGGLSVDSTTGHISGTPGATFDADVTISATNCCGTGYATLHIKIAPATCPDPTLQCDSVSASKTKCGFPEVPGSESTPPKMYLSRFWAGTLLQKDFSPGMCDGGTPTSTYQVQAYGTCTYDRDTCTTSGDNKVDEYINGSFFDTITDDANDLGNYAAFCATPGRCTKSVTDPTQAHWLGTAACLDDSIVTGDMWETMSSEYTSALLISDTEGAVPAYPGTWTGTCQASRDLSVDEMTYSIERFQYRFQLPSMFGITNYRIDWVERFTPEGGGSPTDTAKSYVWDGSAAYSDVHTVTEPGSDGTITIASIVVTCS